MPFIYKEELILNISYSITELKSSKILYLNELLLLYKNYLKAKGVLKISQNENDNKYFSIQANIRIEGEGLFKYYNENSKGIIKIDEERKIFGIEFFRNNQSIFSAKIKNQEK